MLNKAELILKIEEMRKELDENGEQQERIKNGYSAQIKNLEKLIAEKEEDKKVLSEKKPLFSFTRSGKEHAEKISAIEKEIEQLRADIDNIYTSDEVLMALRKRCSVLYPEWRAAQEQLKEIEFNEKLTENCVLIFATNFSEKDLIEVVIDGKNMGRLPKPVGFYYVGEGAHTVCVERNYGVTESVQFRLQGNNKYLYYKFEYYGSGYSKNSSNTFEEFVRDNGLFDFNVSAIKDYILNM